MSEFLDSWNTLSSEGVFGARLDILGNAGKWAGAAAKLIGLIS